MVNNNTLATSKKMLIRNNIGNYTLSNYILNKTVPTFSGTEIACMNCLLILKGFIREFKGIG